MQSKPSTDIDRKLAIYYHPLFQQIIKIILDLFHSPYPHTISHPNPNKQQKFELGLLQFVQFNLKLQKALLPSFQLDNALISGLNDWVKQVAQCLSYQGMVSTIGCVEVTSTNIIELIQKQYNNSQTIQKQYQENKDKDKQKYIESLLKISNHDAFKLLGVKINKQVFSKFMFDLCSTWCQFLDVQLFSYFLIGLYIQISQGQTIQNSYYKNTNKITTIDLQFMQEFQEIKSVYNRIRRKQLRYYRAWCQWNYLRVNQAGQRLILKLDQLHPDDNRILGLAMVFQRAIQIINQQISSQNPLGKQKQVQRNRSVLQGKNKQQKNKDKDKGKQGKQDKDKQGKDFLILKKLNIQTSIQKQDKKQPSIGINYQYAKQQQSSQTQTQQQQQYTQPIYEDNNITIPQDFQIQIDQQGNMYLKRIVKLPVIGVKIEPKPLEQKMAAYQVYLMKKDRQYREVSNLYRKMDNMKIRLQHNAKNDPYTFKKNAKIQERDNFYEQQAKPTEKRKNQMDKTIHQKMVPDNVKKQEKAPQIPYIKRQQKVSLRQTKQYIHKVMAPAFLTDDANNLSFLQAKQGQIYANSANDQKRELRIGLPKIKNLQFRVKQIKSYHIVGKLVNDRSIINEKVRSASIDMTKQTQKSKLDNLKDQNKHILQRYVDQEQIKELNNYQEFYYKLQEAKRKFGREFQSQFRVNLRPMLAYENKRYELGGIITKQDQQRFSQRISKLINKQNRRNKRKQKKQKLRQYRNNFKNKKQKSLYEDIFINYHKDALKQLRNQRKRNNSMITN